MPFWPEESHIREFEPSYKVKRLTFSFVCSMDFIIFGNGLIGLGYWAFKCIYHRYIPLKSERP